MTTPESPKKAFDPSEGPGLLPSSSVARRIPLCHPLDPPPATRLRKVYRPYKFSNRLVSVVDVEFDKRREARVKGVGLQNYKLPNENSDSEKPVLADVGNGSFEVGEWFTLKDKDEVLDESMMPFLGDMMVNLPDLLPKEMRGDY